MILINEKLLHDIKFSIGGTAIYHIEGMDNDYKIVNKEKSHNFCFSNFTINESIKEFYYIQSNRFFSKSEYDWLLTTGYLGEKKRTLKPYPLIINGAYYNRIDLILKLMSVASKNNKIRIKGNKIRYLEDLIPYFNEYSQGFEKGYKTFEEEKINPYLNRFSDKEDYVNSIFEFVTKKTLLERGWFDNQRAFTFGSSDSLNCTYEIINGFTDGEQQGYFYKAWEVILSNNKNFQALFEDKYKELLSIDYDDSKILPIASFSATAYPFEKHFKRGKKQVNPECNLIDIPFVINEKNINDLTEILADYFSIEDLIELKSILPNLSKPRKKLDFLENGNKLSDTFKQLLENKLIIRCNKVELTKWIVECFRFKNKTELQDYKEKTVECTISSKTNYCKNPLIQIIDGNIERKI